MRTLLAGTLVVLGLMALWASQAARLQETSRAHCTVTTGDENCGLGESWTEQVAALKGAL